jgi:hypothetical protein
MIGADADQDAITRSVHDMVADVQQYVPGYTLRAEPQFDDPRESWNGHGRVALFLEVEGNGDYLPAYAGNLDIMTAAAARIGELMARRSRSCGIRPTIANDVRLTDTTLRDGSHAMAHQFTEVQVRDTAGRWTGPGRGHRGSHGDGIGGSSFNYGFSHTDEMTLIAAAARRRAPPDRGVAGARHRHRGRPAPGP